MKKKLALILAAALVLAGCGSSTAPAAAPAQQEETAEETAEAVEEAVEEETAEVVEETAEATAEAEAQAEAPAAEEPAAEAEVDESELLPEAKVEEVLAGAEIAEKRMGAFVSASGLTEADEYSSGNLISYTKDIYTFSMPSTWKDSGSYITVESFMSGAAVIALQAQDLSSYGTLTDEQVEAVLSTYEEMTAEDFQSAFGLEDMDISGFERLEFLDGQKAVAASFEGKMQGMDAEGILLIGVDTVNSRLIVVDMIQTLACKNSHFNDFKTFMGTMTY